eukprot:scaffold1271_cov167-Amphora_coffeaeformis.AAC.13
METVRRDLEQKVGIRPSNHWLTDCWQALSLERNPVAADDVLQQVLHHDLRDVVRTFESDNSHEYDSLPSFQLRHALRQSQQPNHQFKAQLPEGFLLLVQIEEVLDVSVNAMTRLEHGPTSANSSPAPAGNQSKRCLKIAYTDGFTASGQPTFDDENEPPQEILVAMEVQLIVDLSVHSLAGLKIILKGPLQIRHGVALWHAGNTTVIGGSVDALVDMQHQALQQAKRLAGVGVDPTVRALIGTQTLEEEENNDEGEHESSDVPAPPAPAPTAHVSQVVPPRASPPVSLSPMPPPQPPPPPPSMRTLTPPVSRNPYIPPSSIANPYASTAGSQTINTHSSGSDNNNNAHRRDTHVNSTTKDRNNVAPRCGSVSTIRQNGKLSQGISSVSTRVSNASPTRTSVNPYARVPNSISGSNMPQSTSSVVNDTVAIEDDDGNTAGEVVPMQVDAIGPSRILFAELWTLVKRFIQSPESFRQAINQEWIVEMQQYQPRVDFNILSQKAKDASKRKEYIFWLLFKFGAPANPSQLVTCQIHTNMVEAHMGHTPADLRKMRKSNGVESQRICKEGGHRLLSRISAPRTYRVTLAGLPDEYWQQAQPQLMDGKQPILHIQEL